MRQPRVFHLLQRAHSALFRAADRELKSQIGLTAAQQGLLFVLMIKDGVPISDVADRLQMGKSTLTGLVDRMERRGLVQRQTSDTDGRSLKLYIEPAGRALAEDTLPATKAINTALLDPFSSDERAVIERFLKHVASQSEDIVSDEMALIKTKEVSL